jgi:hypothetical protein
LSAAYRTSPLAVFEQATSDAEPEQLSEVKAAADRLVSLRMATYVDEARTQIAITNAGRYWAANGGYFAFLKEEPPSSRVRQRNAELETLRMSYMKLRLNTFWWSFGLSIASFVIAIISIFVAMAYGGRFQ